MCRYVQKLEERVKRVSLNRINVARAQREAQATVNAALQHEKDNFTGADVEAIMKKEAIMKNPHGGGLENIVTPEQFQTLEPVVKINLLEAVKEAGGEGGRR